MKSPMIETALLILGFSILCAVVVSLQAIISACRLALELQEWVAVRGTIISMTSYVHVQPSKHISAHDRAISGIISHNQYHMTSGHFLCSSVSSVPLIMIHPCSLLVLVPLVDTSALCALLQHLSLQCAVPVTVHSVFRLTHLHY